MTNLVSGLWRKFIDRAFIQYIIIVHVCARLCVYVCVCVCLFASAENTHDEYGRRLIKIAAPAEARD